MEKYNRKIELSERVSAVVSLVPMGGKVADVGCDHGFVSVYLVQNGIAERVIAMDVNPGPLSRAKEHVDDYEMEAYIELRLSDGLSLITKEDGVDTAVLAGMGGKLMEKIISDALARGLYLPTLVLQPQSDLMSFRRFLRERGYVITEEKMVLEEGKYYPMMKACYNGARREGIDYETEYSDAFGPCLVADRNPVLHSFLLREIEKFEGILTEMEQKRGRDAEVEKKLEFLKRAQMLF